MSGPPEARAPAEVGTWTLLAVLEPAAEYLDAAGVESARFEAELILAHVLGLSRLDLYLQYERPLSDEERARYRSLLKRRRAREPVQQILGETEFFSLPFAMTPGVFIPRPETEVLVERVLRSLDESRPPDAENPSEAEGSGFLRVLELGAGSGVIAVSLARQRRDLRVWASDISTDALTLSAANAESNGVADRIFLEERDGLPVGDGEPVQLIVSNPPYVRPEEAQSLPPEVADHDPPAALFGGEDGLDFYRRLAEEAPGRLAEGGLLAVEIGAQQGEAVREIFSAAGFADVEVLPDYAGRDRIVTAVKS